VATSVPATFAPAARRCGRFEIFARTLRPEVQRVLRDAIRRNSQLPFQGVRDPAALGTANSADYSYNQCMVTIQSVIDRLLLVVTHSINAVYFGSKAFSFDQIKTHSRLLP
jgi:hypothetical protein